MSAPTIGQALGVLGERVERAADAYRHAWEGYRAALRNPDADAALVRARRLAWRQACAVMLEAEAAYGAVAGLLSPAELGSAALPDMSTSARS